MELLSSLFQTFESSSDLLSRSKSLSKLVSNKTWSNALSSDYHYMKNSVFQWFIGYSLHEDDYQVLKNETVLFEPMMIMMGKWEQERKNELVKKWMENPRIEGLHVLHLGLQIASVDLLKQKSREIMELLCGVCVKENYSELVCQYVDKVVVSFLTACFEFITCHKEFLLHYQGKQSKISTFTQNLIFYLLYLLSENSNVFVLLNSMEDKLPLIRSICFLPARQCYLSTVLMQSRDVPIKSSDPFLSGLTLIEFCFYLIHSLPKSTISGLQLLQTLKVLMKCYMLENKLYPILKKLNLFDISNPEIGIFGMLSPYWV